MPKAILTTRHGDITLGFLPEVAPGHVENFIELAKKGFYDGTQFHRCIPDLMIQGGDPNSKNPDKRLHGTGGSGKNIKAEFSKTPHTRGTVSMARSASPDSASSQFFIVVADSSHLDNQYSAFGKVESGLDVVDKIVNEETDHRDNPVEAVAMTVKIVED